MKLNRRARLDTSQIRDRRGAGRGGPGGLGGLGGLGTGGRRGRAGGGVGGIAGVVLLLVVLFAGGGGLLAGGGGGGDGTSAVAPAGGELESCRNLDTDRECRFVAIENSLQDHWADQLGEGYVPATLNVFDGGVTTGCGQASSQVGPFYCPADQGVYLDLGFFDELRTRFGAQGGDFAEAYIIAHELGHHVQHLTGQMDRVRTREGEDSDAVRLELQADCYAGVWAGNATEGPEALITEISASDIAGAVDAAERVGDDYIQETFGDGVDPERWTHGSSEQRRRWFEVGLASGDPRTCDTFGAAAL